MHIYAWKIWANCTYKCVLLFFYLSYLKANDKYGACSLNIFLFWDKSLSAMRVSGRAVHAGLCWLGMRRRGHAGDCSGSPGRGLTGAERAGGWGEGGGLEGWEHFVVNWAEQGRFFRENLEKKCYAFMFVGFLPSCHWRSWSCLWRGERRERSVPGTSLLFSSRRSEGWGMRDEALGAQTRKGECGVWSDCSRSHCSWVQVRSFNMTGLTAVTVTIFPNCFMKFKKNLCMLVIFFF